MGNMSENDYKAGTPEQRPDMNPYGIRPNPQGTPVLDIFMEIGKFIDSLINPAPIRSSKRNTWDTQAEEPIKPVEPGGVNWGEMEAKKELLDKWRK